MQTELLLQSEITSAPAVRNLPAIPSGLIDTLADALMRMRAARGCDDHAIAVDDALSAALPAVQHIAMIFASSWPTPVVDVDDLVQEALIELTASLAFAPRVRDQRLAAWLSALAFDVMHQLWETARVSELAMAVAHDTVAVVESSHATWAADNAVADFGDAHDSEHETLDAVLRELSDAESLVLALRRDGHSWRMIARLVGTSPRGAQRRGARALAAARNVVHRPAGSSAIYLAAFDARTGNENAFAHNDASEMSHVVHDLRVRNSAQPATNRAA